MRTEPCWESQHCSSIQSVRCIMQRQTEGCSGTKQNTTQQRLQSLPVTDVTRRRLRRTLSQTVCPPNKGQKHVCRLDWYLVHIRHEVLVERADQHVEGPLTLLGKRRCLQCGFLSIDYWRRLKREDQKMQIHWHIVDDLYFLTFD